MTVVMTDVKRPNQMQVLMTRDNGYVLGKYMYVRTTGTVQTVYFLSAYIIRSRMHRKYLPCFLDVKFERKNLVLWKAG